MDEEMEEVGWRGKGEEEIEGKKEGKKEGGRREEGEGEEMEGSMQVQCSALYPLPSLFLS